MKAAPTAPAVVMKGKRSFASWGEISSALGDRPLDLAQARLGGGDAQRSDLLPADLVVALRGQAVVELDRVLHQAGQVLLGAELPHQAGGVPGRALGDLSLLQQQHVRLAPLGQVIGDRAADGAAADDDDPCLLSGHRPSPSLSLAQLLIRAIFGS
jgi:hypothetical protein